MNKDEYRNLQYLGIGIFIGVIYFFILSSRQPIDFFISVGICFAVIVVMASGEWCIDHCRLETRRFYTNLGIKKHCSIIDDDIIENLKDAYQDETFTVFRPGGSSVWWMPFRGMDDIYIAKSDLVEKNDGMTEIKGDWHIIKDFQMLPRKWQNRLLNKYEKERGFFSFKPGKHKVFFAENYTGNNNQVDVKSFSRTQALIEQEGVINTQRTTIEDLQTILRSGNLIARELKNRDAEEQKPRYKYVKVED